MAENMDFTISTENLDSDENLDLNDELQVLFAFMSLGNRKCKYARYFANITGKMQIIKDYQLY
jgi:hypothetical protein